MGYKHIANDKSFTKRIYIGGVNLFYTRLTAEALTCRLRGCLGWVNLFCIHINVEWLPRWVAFTFSRCTRLTAEWLPRWGQSENHPIVASVGYTRFQLSGCLGRVGAIFVYCHCVKTTR